MELVGRNATGVRHGQRWNRFDGSGSQIRKTKGCAVRSFRELIDEVAVVTVNNWQYEMFYRGQAREYMDSQGAFMPTDL